MEITCNRCQTEYDFDDALVSERGTTVRCTNCGEQFKVYRTNAPAAPERWVVTRADGRELVFTSLRDLQRAISNQQVDRRDTLTRGSAPARPLGSIAELEPFFAGASSQAGQPQAGRPRSVTRRGLSPVDPAAASNPSSPAAASGPSAPQREVPVAGAPSPPAGQPLPSPSAVAEPRQDRGETMAAPLAQAPVARFAAAAEPLRQGTAGYAPLAPDSPRPVVPAVPPSSNGGSRLPPNTPGSAASSSEPRMRAAPAYIPRPAPDEARISYSPEHDWFGEPRFSGSPPPRSRALKWLAVLAVLGLLGFAGATVGRKYLAMVIRPAPVADGNQGRVDALLEDGDRALTEGDLETAKESYDKASALAENDPRVLLDLARLEAARADVGWLRLRLIPADPAEVRLAADQAAQQSAMRARKAAEHASDAAPDDPKVVRARIDALRISGDLLGARALVPRVSGIASHPATSYVLAALDLAESNPNFGAVIERLKSATPSEYEWRTHAALVYAATRSGDLALARAELAHLGAAPHPFALVAELKAFIARSGGAELDAGKRDIGPSARDAGHPVLEAKADNAAALANGTESPRASEGETLPPGDFRTLLQQAAQALGKRQYDRAEQLYRGALAKNPGDTEALGGLGDVARARGNSSLAMSYYEQVIDRNPHYLPVLTALADMRWQSGDRAGAVKLYKELVEAAPDTAAAERARQRIADSDSNGAAKPLGKQAPGHPSPPPPPSPSPESPPEIDTSDLPGFGR